MDVRQFETEEDYIIEEEKAPAEKNVIYSTDSTFDIVSKVAYLSGVPERFFINEEKRLQLSVYTKLDRDKNARIIRNLCIVRTAIERGFKKINNFRR